MKQLHIVFLAVFVTVASCGMGTSSEREKVLSLKQAFSEMPSRAGGCYHSYEGNPGVDTPAPSGYKPFYISHYGRHGSRYHTPKMLSRCYPRELERASALGMLTEEGEQVLARMKEVYRSHEGNTGNLTPRGEREHMEIGRRMAARFPEVFAGRDSIRAIATNYPRCQASMQAFLKGLGTSVRSLWTDSGKLYYSLLCPESEDQEVRFANVSARQNEWRADRIDPAAMQARLFREGFEPDSIQMVLKGIYIYGCQEEDLDFPTENSLFSFFTMDELFMQWTVYSDVVYGEIGPSQEYYDSVTCPAKGVLAHILDQASASVWGSDVAADLRFAHDNGLVPLLSLIGVDGFTERVSMDGAWKTWPSYERIPMASNLQIVFYGNDEGDVLVKLLFNEKEVTIPALQPFSCPYYRWKDLEHYFKSKVL